MTPNRDNRPADNEQAEPESAGNQIFSAICGVLSFFAAMFSVLCAIATWQVAGNNDCGWANRVLFAITDDESAATRCATRLGEQQP